MENIFEAAGKQNRSLKNKTSHDKPRNDFIKKIPDNSSYTELHKMLKQMQAMKKNLEDQMADIYQKGKEKKLNPLLFIDNPRDLTAKQLEKMAEEEKKLIDKINAITPPEACLKKVPKSKEKLAHERSNKMRGARNNWIPMR